MSATSTTEEFAAVIEDPDDPTVAVLWASYDMTERELWREYEAEPTFTNGRVYLAGEQLARRRCERAVERARFRRIR